jgi:hypothetical protein
MRTAARTGRVRAPAAGALDTAASALWLVARA